MADTRKIYVLNGPNLNMLGTREPEIYGYDTLDDIAERMEDAAHRAHVEIDFRQSNHEGHLVDWVQEAHREGAHAIIMNPGAYTHTSIALHDAIKSITVPVIEIHLSNPHSREPFRHHSYFSDKAVGVVCGFGANSYRYAMDAALRRLAGIAA